MGVPIVTFAGSAGSPSPVGPTSIPILDNQAIPQLLFRYPVASYPFSFLMYSIERNGGRRIVLHKDVTDGVSVSGGNDQNVVGPDVGVTVTHAVVAGYVEHYYISTNTGNNGTFKWYRIAGWA